MSSSDEDVARSTSVRGFHLLWHPQQGLWNRELFRRLQRLLPWRPAYKTAQAAVVFVDTVLLAGRALTRRLSDAGTLGRSRRPMVPGGVAVYYFDLGTHRDAAELAYMLDRVLPRLSERYEAYGFEASKSLLEQAKARLAGREHVSFVHAAVCHVPPAGGTVRLYVDSCDGVGNSLFRPEFGEYQEVPALRFSDWLNAQKLDVQRNICLLRMNIEGAECDVITDLIESGVARCIDGYFGMWDDLSKIDPQADARFRSLLASHHIKPFTFNGRELGVPLRMWSIQYEVRTCVRRGLRRVSCR